MPEFDVLGKSHLIVLTLTLVAAISMFWVRKLPARNKQFVRRAIAAVLICQILAYNIWHLYHSSWDINSDLPLHLSWIANYLTVISLLLNRKLLYQITYYMGTWSALLATIFPDLHEGFPSFRFWEYFISHCFILIGIAYICFVKRIRMTYQSLWISAGYIVLLGIVAYIFNLLTGANYMYLLEVPVIGEFLPPHPYNFPILMAIVLVFLHLQYLPYFYCRINR